MILNKKTQSDYLKVRISLESLLNCSLAELRPLNSVGHWFYPTNSSAPPQVSLCVSDSPSHHHHDHTVTLFCPRRHTTHSPTFYARRHAVQKTSEVGANPESRLTLSTHQLFTFTFPLSYSSRWRGGLWEPTASCIRSLIKKVFRNLQCQMHSLKVLPTFTTRQTIPSNIPKGGQQAWTDEI